MAKLSDKQAQMIADRLVARVNEANTYFLEQIGGHLKKIKTLTPTDAHKLIQILKYGDNYDNIIKNIEKITNLNIKEIDTIFKEYAKTDMLFYKQFYNYKGIPFKPYNENIALVTQTKALANIVKNELYNYTRANVLSYSMKDLNGNITTLGLRETYNKILDEAFLKISQGKDTFDTGMRSVLEQLGGSGLRTVDFESGRSVRLDTIVRTQLRGRLRELHNEVELIANDDIDFDGVEISVHLNPAPDHQDVQGKQFYTEEYLKLQNSGMAKTVDNEVIDLHLVDKNGVPYETFRPISELNCYHYIFGIVVGVSEPEYSKAQLKQIIEDNNKGFELDGKHYTNYEGTQLQRRIESEIRKQKDIKTLAEASGDDLLKAKAQTKITQLRAKYKQITLASGLKPKMKRTRI